jgi:hypothetical protein
VVASEYELSILTRSSHDPHVERRRNRRWDADGEVMLILEHSAVAGHLVDESESGCRVRHSLPQLPPELTIRIHGQEMIARRVWSRQIGDATESGLHFPAADPKRKR